MNLDHITLSDISNSADIVWVAVVHYEDTNDFGAALKMINDVTDAERALFFAACEDVDRVKQRDADVAAYLAEQTPSKWNPRNITKVEGFDYERAILTAQGY